MRDELKEIKWVPIKDVKPNEKNRNKHPKEQIDRLALIIDRHGWRHPLVVSEQSGLLVIGHGRLEAAKKLKLKEVPVMVQKFNSPEEEFEVAVADNAIPAWAELDLSGIQLDLPDFDPTLLNLDALGLKDFRFEPLEKIGQCDEDEVPEKVEPRTKLGYLYELGDHRLLCGDSTNIQHVERLMDGKNADMVFTDPPYGINLDTDYLASYGGGEALPGREKHTAHNVSHKPVANDDKDFDPTFILSHFKNCKEIFLWGANYYWNLLNNNKTSSIVVWDKRVSESLRKMHGNQLELCWSKSKHAQIVLPITWCGAYGSDEGKAGHKKVHPTQKPIKLAEYFLNEWGNKDDIVVDLFGGSGSTLIACEKTNRKCFMMELDPHYVDIIVARWEKYTGKKAILNDSTT